MTREAAATEFWSENQPGFRFAVSPPGSLEFFAEIEQHRYATEPHIPEVVRFERWRDCDVLEAGCGIATDGVRFSRVGARYVGIDANRAALTLARQHLMLEALPGRLAEGSVTRLPFADECFDLVFSHGVIHHIDDTERAVEEICRVLRPGGTALVMLYHRNSLNYWFNIMALRRVLAVFLLVPGALPVVSRLTGERIAVLDGHRRLLATLGLKYILDTGLFLSNNTDGPGNPLSKVYSRASARRLFGPVGSIRTSVRNLNLRLFPAGPRLARTGLARRLERRFGWHLYVEVVKDANAMQTLLTAAGQRRHVCQKVS